MNKSLVADLVQRLPAATLSRVFGLLARSQQPKLAVAVAKRIFVAASGADLSEANDSIDSYKSLEELFVRNLRDGARPIDDDDDAVVSPVDGMVGACGTVSDGTLLQVKGCSYSLSALLRDEDSATRFEGGPYATLYLSPRDYHHVHAPLAGEVRDARVIPGRLLPVFPDACARIDALFARNERFVTYLDTPYAGRLAVVKVGATMVGRISVVYDRSARTNSAQRRDRELHYDAPYAFNKGDEIGVFELGSTVVLVGERQHVRFDGLTPGQKLRMGTRIGTVLNQSTNEPTVPRNTAKPNTAPKPKRRSRRSTKA